MHFVDARAVNNLDETSRVVARSEFPEYPAVELGVPDFTGDRFEVYLLESAAGIQ